MRRRIQSVGFVSPGVDTPESPEEDDNDSAGCEGRTSGVRTAQPHILATLTSHNAAAESSGAPPAAAAQPSALPGSLSASIVCAGRRSDKGLKKGGWRRSLGGTPMREGELGTSGADENATHGAAERRGVASTAQPPLAMALAMSQVLERMQSTRSASDHASEDDVWGE